MLFITLILMSSKKLNLKALINKIEKLAPEELQEIQSVIEILLKPSSEQSQEDLSSPAQPEKRKRGRPKKYEEYYEWKKINGCGPYRYRRYWDGGILRSEYAPEDPTEQ
jgi:AT hook motif